MAKMTSYTAELVKLIASRGLPSADQARIAVTQGSAQAYAHTALGKKAENLVKGHIIKGEQTSVQQPSRHFSMSR